MKKRIRKTLALLLALAMTAGTLPDYALCVQAAKAGDTIEAEDGQPVMEDGTEEPSGSEAPEETSVEEDSAEQSDEDSTEQSGEEDAPEAAEPVTSGNVSEAGSTLLAVDPVSDYTVSEDGTLTAYTGAGGDLTIPANVKKIAEGVFSKKTGITGVTLPEGLEEIGATAFKGVDFGYTDDRGAKHYGTLTIPGSVRSIGARAFEGCAYLQEVTFSMENEASELVFGRDNLGLYNTFGSCPVLEKAVLPNRMTEVADGMFSKCSSLKTVTIGDGHSRLTKVGDSAFEDCTSLEGIELPGSVETIGASAFDGCTRLETAVLNEGLKTIGNYAFQGAGFGYTDDNGAKRYGTLTIPGSVRSIGGSAFRGCAYLKEVTFSMENEAAELVFGRDNLGLYNTFDSCPVLEKAVLPNRMTDMVDNMFENCSSLKTVTIGDGHSRLTRVGNSTFRNCTSLEGIELPGSVETIGNYAFRNAGFGYTDDNGAKHYGTLTIPGSVRSIGASAFEGCAYLKEVTFSMENEAAELVFGMDATGHCYTFNSCPVLEKAVLPNRMTEMADEMFSNCSSLKTVTIGDGHSRLTKVGNSAFKNCTSLEGIELPGGVETIGESAFKGCTRLETAALNEGLKTIGASAFQDAGFGYTDDNGAKHYGTLTIPGSVRSIGASAFRGCAYLKEVTFSMENEAAELVFGMDATGHCYTFNSCPVLEKAVLPNRMTEMADEMFSNCSSLKTVTIGDGHSRLTKVGNSAFKNCTSLEGIELPGGVETIGESAFKGCTRLETAALNEGLKTIGNCAFQGAGFGYKDDDGKAHYGTVTIPGSVQSIGARAFEGCSYLQAVDFVDGTAAVLEFALLYGTYGTNDTFMNCPELQTVLLPERLTVLPVGAFENCPKLEKLYIPKSVKTIQERAIYQCPALTIYGETGSAAEKYASENNIPFKTKDALGFNVTGVSLNKTQITAYGEEAIGSKVQLKAVVEPLTAKNKSVSYSSSDEKVATVDGNGLVTLTGYGKADITVTTADGGKTAVCHVEVIRSFSEEEKKELSASFLELNKLTVLTNVSPTVEGIAIKTPEGYEASWKRASDAILTGEHTYEIVVKKDGYMETDIAGVMITGITVTGVKVSGKNKLQTGKDAVYGVQITGEGMKEGETLSAADYELRWTTSQTSVLSVKSADGDQATVGAVKGKKTASVKVVLALKKDGVALPVGNSAKGVTWFETSMEVKTYDEAIADKIVITAAKGDQTVELDSLEELADIEAPLEYRLTAEVYEGETKLEAPSLKWSTSNPKTAQIKINADKTVQMVVNEKGAAVITVTADKNGDYKESFRVVVKDSTPRLEETSVEINLYQITPSAVLHLYPSDGYAISTESLKIVNADGTESEFTISQTDGEEYLVGVKNGASLTGGKKKVFVSVTTSKQEAEPHRLPLVIQVGQKKPKVTITQTAEDAINLYEKDGEGYAAVSADAPLKAITFTPNSNSGARLVSGQSGVDENNNRQGYFTYQAEGADSRSYTKTSAKGTLEITFDGYKPEAAFKKTITLKTNKKLPAFTAVPSNSTLYPSTVADHMDIFFGVKGEDGSLERSEGWSAVPANTVAGLTVQMDQTDVAARVTMQNNAKGSSTLKFNITNTNWYDGVKATASCKLTKGAKPVLAFSNANVILNTKYVGGNYAPLAIGMSVKNYNGQTVTELLSVEGKKAKDADALKALDFSLGGDGKLCIRITDGSYFKQKAKYTYVVRVNTEENMTLEGTLNVTVAVASATVKFKQSGSIDLLNRAGSQIVCKPTFANYTDTVKDVYLSGVGADSFTTELENGNIVIRAAEGAKVNVKTTYKPMLYVELESGVILHNQIKITPKQTNPKLVQNVKKLSLFESVCGEQYAKEVTIEPAPGKAGTARITDIELVNGGDTFVYEYRGEGTGMLYVSENASSKVNKNYKLTFAVTFEDAGSNAAPVKVTVTVNYKK